MSYAETLAIYPGEKVESIEEYKNSWGLAMALWDVLAKHYLNMEAYGPYPARGYMQDIQKLWDLWKDPRVKVEHKIVFMFTFDRAYVAKRNYKRMADAIRVTFKDLPIPAQNVNHWPALADFFDSDPDYPGVGLYGTSVGENSFQGPWNEEKEDYDPPDWSTIYELCDEVDSLNKDDEADDDAVPAELHINQLPPELAHPDQAAINLSFINQRIDDAYRAGQKSRETIEQ